MHDGFAWEVRSLIHQDSLLLQNSKIPSNGWIPLRMKLKAILLQTNFPLSQTPRSVAIENLVKAGSNENLVLAQQGITLLLALSDSKRKDFRRYLDPKRAAAISPNYRTLTSSATIKETHRFFESQLGRTSLDNKLSAVFFIVSICAHPQAAR